MTMNHPIRSLLVCALAVACHNVNAGPAAGGSFEAWQRHRDAMSADAALLRFYTFENVDGGTVAATGADAPMSFQIQKKAGAPAETLRRVAGRWPQKKAVRLDAGWLAGPAFSVGKAFTLEAWMRWSGPGAHRGNDGLPNGTLLALGNGYWEGLRLTTGYPEKRINFEIGRPKPSHSIGTLTGPVADGLWHHLAAIWDGGTMQLYVDGMSAASGKFAGPFTAPAAKQTFRIGFADSGVGSVVLDVDEVAVFNRALTAGELLRHAYFYAPVPDSIAAHFDTASRCLSEKNHAAAGKELSQVTRAGGLHCDLLAVARLQLAEALRGERKTAAASAEIMKVFNTANLCPQLNQLASAAAVKLFKEAPGCHLTRETQERILSLPEITSEERLGVRLSLGHARFAERDYAAARAEYARVLAQADAPPALRAITQLRVARSFACQRDYATAKAELAKVSAISDAPAHFKSEAAERLKEIERLEHGQPARDPAASRTPPPPWPAPAVSLFVSPQGNDRNTGTKEQPFATLERARDEIRTLRNQNQKSKLQNGVAVLIRGGAYTVKQTFKLTVEDSGTAQAPVVYAAFENEKPVFSGGARVRGFKRVTDAAVLARLPEEARGKVWQSDLKAQGLSDYGRFEPGGYCSGRGFRTHPTLELFFDGKPMEISRWPNEGFVTSGEALGPQQTDKRGQTRSVGGQFVYAEDRPARWKDENDAWLYGYWYHDWADSYEKVASIDTARRVITLAPPLHHYGFKDNRRYYALNLLSEIDRPGEWYLDRERGVLYLWPPSNPDRAVVEISMFAAPFVELNGAAHVAFRRLTWETGRSDGLRIKDGGHCLLAGCTVRNLAGDGIVIDGGKDHGLLGCDISSMGRGGVTIHAGDRKTLTPCGHFIENCHIHHLSRIDHTYTPAVLANGVGIRIAHNLMHHIGSSAMRVEGNEHLVEFNEVHNVVLESDDQGGVDSFGDPTYRGNIFRFNYWHHIGNWRHQGPDLMCGQAGIRLDDAISGVLIYGNVFYRSSAGQHGFGGVQIHGGKDNVVDNNVFVDCAAAISLSPWSDKKWREYTADKLASREIDPALYLARYPALARLQEDHDVNLVTRNLALDCDEFLRRDRGYARRFDNFVTDRNPGFSAPALGDFNTAKPTPEMARAGFDPVIPFAEIGLYRDSLRPQLPERFIIQARSGR